MDENIRSLKDCQVALALGSCRSINLKIPRVGGIHEALKIATFCQENDLLVWLGGMFESGVGRALNLQFASQPTFSFQVIFQQRNAIFMKISSRNLLF